MPFLKVNDLVVVGDGCHLAVITKKFQDGEHWLHHAHYLDIATGSLMKCPDKRCKGDHTCPVHGMNVHAARKVTPRDAKIYLKDGLISRSIAALALQD